eukprot:6461004-Amphidinium_carterae.1
MARKWRLHLSASLLVAPLASAVLQNIGNKNSNGNSQLHLLPILLGTQLNNPTRELLNILFP